MDVRIGNLVRLLQAGPFNQATLRQAETALAGLRGHRELGDMHGDLLVLLDDFAESAEDRRTGARAYLLAAELCDAAAAAEQWVERLVLAMNADPADRQIPKRLRAALHGPAERPRLLALLSLRATALAEDAGIDGGIAAEAHALLGAELMKDGQLDGAISAYERALDLDPTLSAVETLAGLYARRAADGDAAQGADLYCLLAELSEPSKQGAALARALALVPNHAEALERRAALTQVAGAPAGAPAEAPAAAETQAAGIAAAAAVASMTAPTTQTAHPAPAAAATEPARTAATGGVGADTQAAMNASAPGAQLQATHVAATPREMDEGDSLRPLADLPAGVRTLPKLPKLPRFPSLPNLPKVPARWAMATVISLAVGGVGYAAFGGAGDSNAGEPTASHTPVDTDAHAPAPTTGTHAAAATGAAATPDGPARAGRDVAGKQAARKRGASDTRAKPKRAARRQRRGVVELHRKRVRVAGGKLSKKKALAAVDRRLRKVQRCYRRALKRRPGLKGRLVYRFDVRRNGRARKVEKVAGNIRDRRLQACTGKALRDVRFPRFKGGKTAKVRVPLRFRSVRARRG